MDLIVPPHNGCYVPLLVSMNWPKEAPLRGVLNTWLNPPVLCVLCLTDREAEADRADKAKTGPTPRTPPAGMEHPRQIPSHCLGFQRGFEDPLRVQPQDWGAEQEQADSGTLGLPLPDFRLARLTCFCCSL